ncbi:MAG: hypothetical protein ACD_30C00002G0008 [uncultured bacterium]|uniref:Uncharacterized protein n=4 Tax=Candidatus Daviesiibacteriota TaxID=1752718 RepID=A0A0G0EY31_9BACT|nr:MAG: hypothetical protein ACD_30C00002G0008 [uncultured bacterium]KKQ10402.1 MAG: hypothetical protein US19_C0005G0014 [Candidatus Daviesbacteria bacterium GW2011_GWB1_36_5]KKQ15781.1 MAG: hypothetical protein US28_C0010G0014 [Candidatus Daviesbacteria bacterium GW2011_GWA1_36_8]OGE16561.1 MAG: hypothetical protein A2858_01810 [Candidatus Daviesbacteria bacterium RIFCSPHIGHO2_01_FULL_36_37]OGE31756.1 MAG: hypothetical protein A3C99_02990 [Candidatus Daviesbacteria bacterium RIFCSPHIGHO2_02_F
MNAELRIGISQIRYVIDPVSLVCAENSLGGMSIYGFSQDKSNQSVYAFYRSVSRAEINGLSDVDVACLEEIDDMVFGVAIDKQKTLYSNKPFYVNDEYGLWQKDEWLTANPSFRRALGIQRDGGRK